MTTLRAPRPFPWVDVVCFCHEDDLAPYIPPASAPTTTVFSESAIVDEDTHDEDHGSSLEPSPSVVTYPRALWDPFSRFPLESMYFCEHCHTHRCPRCVETEIVCRYCPQCLFEVTASSARSEGNRCVRSCFRCPECNTGVMTVGAPGARTDESGDRQGYILKCPYCDWNSQHAGLTLSKTTSLVSAVQASALRTQGTIDKRFQAMREFYFERSLEEGVSMAASVRKGSGLDKSDPNAPAVAGRTASSSTFAEILERRIRDKSRKDPGSEIFGDIIEVDEGLDTSNALLQATSSTLLNGGNLPSGIQRDTVDRDQRFPLPQPLRSKRTKRCKACHHILVKPESKPSSAKFKIKLMALYVSSY